MKKYKKELYEVYIASEEYEVMINEVKTSDQGFVQAHEELYDLLEKARGLDSELFFEIEAAVNEVIAKVEKAVYRSVVFRV